MCACRYVRKRVVLHPGEKKEALWVERAAQPHYSNLREHMFDDACSIINRVQGKRQERRKSPDKVGEASVGIKLQFGPLWKEGLREGQRGQMGTGR